MASPTLSFEDGLSEDWVSQPRSSDGTASPGQANLRGSALQSRIPLPVRPAIASKPVSSAAPSSNHASPRPLHTKSKSELNIPILRSLDTRAQGHPRRPPSASRSVSISHRRSSSAQSWTADGTVQHLGSEVRHGGVSGQMTPEWRRRLLNSQETGEQKDLFSPMGLENVFRPPSFPKAPVATQSPKRRGQTRSRVESSMIYPSSPPSYPSTRRRRATTKSVSPTPVRERREHDHNQCLAKGGKCEGALRTPTPTKKQLRTRSSRTNTFASIQNGNDLAKRIQSGTSIAEHESISPVTFRDGQIDYRSIQASVKQLQQKMQARGIPEQERRPSSRSSEHGTDYGATQRRQALLPEVTITSLVEPSALDSEAFAAKARFVNTRRGGFSSDDNFHRHPLSPSSFQPEPSFLFENIVASEPQLPQPKTPRRDERFTQSSTEKPRSGGSPLKLFGQHDTFTNNHLMRRLSQYVEYDDEPAGHTSEPPSPSPRRDAQSSPSTKLMAGENDFGLGILDEHAFPHAESMLADAPQGDDPSLPFLPAYPDTDQAPQIQIHKSRRRASSKHNATAQLSQRSNRRPSLAEFRRSIGDVPDVRADGKRTFHSPQKDHQSKRRRTLLSSVGSLDNSPEPPSIRLSVGKKRTDARPGDRARKASPAVMAQRSVLRPRSVSSPRPREDSSSTMSSWLGAASTRRTPEQPEPSDLYDFPTKVLAEDLANFAVNVAAMTNGERKTSVTTADFFKEANMIMRHLRGQAQSPGSQTPNRRTPSGRQSGDNSIVDYMSDIEELDEESIRSLRSLQKQGSLRSNISSVLHSLRSKARGGDCVSDKLQKYKESDEVGLKLGASVRNLEIAPDHVPEDEVLPETDAPHIRILARAPDEMQTADGEVHTAIRTRSSTDVSLGRSIRTGESSSSSRKYNIAPETVKNLLSDHVGRMTFDHSKGVWVRNRTDSLGDRPASSHLNSDGTEEDPLKSIPDLEDDDHTTVQTSKPPGDSKRVSSTGTVINRSSEGQEKRDPTSAHPSLPDAETRSRPSSGHGADSSQLSRFSKFGSSQTAPETRATSWSTAPPMKSQPAAVEPDLPQVEEVAETSENQQIGEEAILEPNEPASSPLARDTQHTDRRLPTALFSSPFSSIPDNVLFPSSSRKGSRDLGQVPLALLPPLQQTPVRRTRIASALLRSKEKAKRHLSVVKQRYTDRPVSRIDEQDEQDESRSVAGDIPETSLVLATPQDPRKSATNMLNIPPPSSGRHSSILFHRSLHLEPLSDFTVHNEESLNLDIDYVRKRQGLATDDEIDTRFNLAIRDLVARMTDIEPYEPYWEYLRKLDLSQKNLVTLHALDVLCERLEELDVSNNELGQVNGAPRTLRNLDISHNCLTSMTAWSHLSNLHYLDVSNNQIDSLIGFGALPHLRELRADGNKLTSLEGLTDCSSLMKLSVRNNRINDADFSECDLFHLEELDLSCNMISAMPGLGRLQALKVLRAADNKLPAISSDDLPSSLTMLDLANNQLTALDLSTLNHLQTLDVDCNSLQIILGLSRATSLETLSWREQDLCRDTSIDFSEASDLRHLAVSGNKLQISRLKRQFLNLNALEMVSCGIEILPSRFGRLMPNLRLLDLSHNAIKDISPLVGIKKLQELLVVGNRIHRLRKTAAVLDKIGTELVSADFRVNPITLGFYSVPPTPMNTARARTKLDLLLKHQHSDNNTLSKVLPLQENALVLGQVQQNQDQERDSTYRARLDEGTALRRRVFELLVYNSCPTVNMVNGLVVDDESIGEQDEAWQRLVELKIVKQGNAGIEDS